MSLETTTLEEVKSKWVEQPMLRPKIGAVKLNVSIGMAGAPLERAKTIIESLTDQTPKNTLAKSTWRNWGIRKFQPVGVTVTVRGARAYELLMRLLHAKEYKVKSKSIDKTGNFSFGINEHIDIPGMDYDPNLGIIGMDVIVQMERHGYRVKKRGIKRRKIPKSHLITPLETKVFLQDQYGVELI